PATSLDVPTGQGHGGAMFVNPQPQEIAALLSEARIIAIVGLSPDRTRPSHAVGRALQRFGYRIIPVNPFAEAVLGEPAIGSLGQLSQVLDRDEAGDIATIY